LVQQESIPWQSFVGCLTDYRSTVHDSKHSCPAPVKGGRAVTIFHFLTSPPAPKCAFFRPDLLNWFLLWQQRPSPGIIITTDTNSVGERTFKRFQTEF
jgi:hypothetical protein